MMPMRCRSGCRLPRRRRRTIFRSLLAQQRPMDTINQEDAVKLLWAYLAYEAYRAFSPLVASLEAKDDARRYVSR